VVYTADELLFKFPALYEISRIKRKELETSGLEAVSYGLDRPSSVSRFDPTAWAGIRLYDLSQLETLLMKVREWIDKYLPLPDRPLLIAVWRYSTRRWYGIRIIAQELRLEVHTCYARWKGMVGNLQVWLEKTLTK